MAVSGWCPARDVPEQFGNWNTTQVLERAQSLAQERGELDWVASIDPTIVRVHQHGATLPRNTGGRIELHEVRA